jgi:hypothetical protein
MKQSSVNIGLTTFAIAMALAALTREFGALAIVIAMLASTLLIVAAIFRTP